MRNVYQTTGKVTGIGCLKGRISQTFAGSVCGYEVLQDRQTFLEVCQDGVLDDLGTRRSRFLGFGHKTAHTRKLPDLFLGPAGPGIQHHIYGVESFLVFLELLFHNVGKTHIDIGPDVQYPVVAFVVGQETHIEVCPFFFYIFVSFFHQGGFFFGYDHVVQVEGQTAPVSHIVSNGLDVVKEPGCTCHSGCF